MILTILIIYIISIFISRQWNKILYKYDSQCTPWCQMWFIPVFNIIIPFIIVIEMIYEKIKTSSNFTGENWKSKN